MGFRQGLFEGFFRTRVSYTRGERIRTPNPLGSGAGASRHLLMNVLHRDLLVSARSLALKREQNLLIAPTMR
jgi:hypothetical protein